ncbi:glucokinase [Nitrosomonas sp. JL21]|uniref:glucokinase n=1 Tax=Nitrosomonas sp. JL21 TaxID=153949 RepID=UPI00136BC8C2|nr:glucokinase [Nitrosomonas sp. JL21]MBL8497358.1 glucokinase [Nitrosomonas sp.]MCC7091534.1 glucokinase [Nitrosomonas sp.]MXS77509.1 glucokinase [Nitrosomonas sp. JL21]
MNKSFIYGDIGGTKTILAIAETRRDGGIHQHFVQRYLSHSYERFSDLLSDFLKQSQVAVRPDAACFAIAGPIVGQQASLTNLPWHICEVDISNEFSISTVKLINDFEAAALAIEELTPNDLLKLQSGQMHEHGMRVVLGAGTGMGVAWLAWLKDRYVPLATEAGHMDFAPANKLQMSLLESLQIKLGHVSVERLLSGAGLTHIFNFLQLHQAVPSGLTATHLKEDSGATITTLAQTHKHPIAIKSLHIFAEIYGAYAGNLALAGLCRGGVYIAGGIAPKIINIISSGGFMRAFRDKGRFSTLMNEIPVHVVTNSDISLLGARRVAQQLLQQSD